jgi:hypothetical protein
LSDDETYGVIIPPTEDERRKMLERVVAEELPILYDVGSPDDTWTRDELIKHLGDSTARMLKSALWEGYQNGYVAGHNKAIEDVEKEEKRTYPDGSTGNPPYGWTGKRFD